MFFFFLLKKLWLIIKMFFSYSSFQTQSDLFFSWNKYLLKMTSGLLIFSLIF